MSAKHTPGPWSLMRQTSDVSIFQEDGRDICDIEFPDDEDMANARLIAKSPELADMLREYALPFEDVDKARAEYGIAAVARELRRRALLAEVTGGGES